MFWTEKRQARRIARAALETSYKAMETDPELEGLELYSKVLFLVFGYDEHHIGEVLERTAASPLEWADNSNEELRLRDIVYYVLVTEHIDVWRRPRLITDIGDVVQKIIPASI